MRVQYTIPEAAQLSREGNPIPLYALGVQGVAFSHGQTMLLNSTTVLLFNTGVLLNFSDPNVIAVAMSVMNPTKLGLSISGGAIILPKTNTFPIMLPMTGNGSIMIEYGTHLADLCFLKAA